MKKIILAVVLTLVLATSVSHAKGIYVVPLNAPDWVVDVWDGKSHWTTHGKKGRYVHGTGIAFTKEAAIDQACENALKETDVKIRPIGNWCQLRKIWHDNEKVYVVEVRAKTTVSLHE